MFITLTPDADDDDDDVWPNLAIGHDKIPPQEHDQVLSL